jgi:hypothetical protein
LFRRRADHGSILDVAELRTCAALTLSAWAIACSPQAHTAPVDTKPIPTDARILDEPCSPKGEMLCEVVHMFSGAAAVERRSACIAYIERSGRRVEQCGSLPASQP